MTTPPVEATPSRVCSRCRTLKPIKQFHKNGRGGHRADCRSCVTDANLSHAHATRTTRWQAKTGLRRCLECKALKPLRHFSRLGEKRKLYSSRCDDCVKLAEAARDPIAEAAEELRKGIRAKQRWAVTFMALVSRWGLDLVSYKALRGELRVRFEREWSEAMKLEVRAETDATMTREQMEESAEGCRPRVALPVHYKMREAA